MADEDKKWKVEVSDQFLDFYKTLPEEDKRAIDAVIKEMSEKGHPPKGVISFDELSPEEKQRLKDFPDKDNIFAVNIPVKRDATIHEYLIDQWNKFREACYGDKKLIPAQYSEVRRAFFSGMFSMLANFVDIFEGAEEAEIIVRLEALRVELNKICMDSIKNLPK